MYVLKIHELCTYYKYVNYVRTKNTWIMYVIKIRE